MKTPGLILTCALAAMLAHAQDFVTYEDHRKDRPKAKLVIGAKS